MTTFKRLLLALTTTCAIFAFASHACAQELELDAELLAEIEAEYEKIFSELKDQRDQAIRSLAAAERSAAVQAQAAATYRLLYTAERANAEKPQVQKWTWFALGAVSSVAACLLAFLLVP